MDIRRVVVISLAVGSIAAPLSASAQSGTAQPVFSAVGAPLAGAASFDLEGPVPAAQAHPASSDRLAVPLAAKASPHEKIKIRWHYEPVAGGPRFEVGALGAGKDTKAKLVHVGMDWVF
ncbi:hypothetical protein LK12_09930 [Novosphingobium malaysiense]|uniref:Porin n=2 Tax=Novosphingobium malaysiense TaxID=1348853 RepID=A0A0B1ZPJ9_9SPHN|nr:hypothetical protein LK12_09930 [Novosphingobium malaysiense]